MSLRICKKQTVWVDYYVPDFCEADVRQMIADGKTVDEIKDYIREQCELKEEYYPSEGVIDGSYESVTPEENNGFATAEIWDDNEGFVIYHNGKMTEGSALLDMAEDE